MQSLETLRKELDVIDKQIVELYERRMQVCEQVAEYKRRNDLPILDQEREKEKLQAVADQVSESCNKSGIQEVFTLLMKRSRERQAQRLGAVGEKE